MPSMTPKPPILLLDVMGTLVYEPFYEDVPAFFGMSLQQLIEQKHPTTWVEFEKGLIGEAEMFARFFRDGRSFDHQGLKSCMAAAYRWLDGVEPLLGELRDRIVPMHVLSNYPAWYRLIEDKLALSRYAEWSFVSCETGVRKPDPEAFLGPARCLGATVDQLIFVDDREGNCEAAQALGLTAIRFRDAARLRSELAKANVL